MPIIFLEIKNKQQFKSFPPSIKLRTNFHQFQIINQVNRYWRSMDLKFRLNSMQTKEQQKQPQERRTTDLNRYQKVSRNTADNDTINKPPERSTLNKYYKKTAAPKSQWNHYMGNTNNVFYQQRQDAKQLAIIRKTKSTLMIVLICLAVLYFSMNSITKFEGQCPQNAYCNVFVHCDPGLQYDKQNNKCVIDPNLIDKAQDICLLAINQLKVRYGDQECSQELENINYVLPPSKRLQQLLSSETLGGDLQNLQHLKDQILSFLMNKQNQELHNFTVVNSKIIPLQKSYSLSCRVNLHVHSKMFILELLGFMFIVLIGFMTYKAIKRRNKASLVYSELKQRLLTEKTINVSNCLEELELKFGKIDRKTWQLVDSLRTTEQRIGYFQQDFLYWRLL